MVKSCETAHWNEKSLASCHMCPRTSVSSLLAEKPTFFEEHCGSILPWVWKQTRERRVMMPISIEFCRFAGDLAFPTKHLHLSVTPMSQSRSWWRQRMTG